jgi:hypothetical protein
MSDYFLNKIYDSLLSNKPVPKKPEPIVEKKETFKPLSKVYEVLVREAVDHRAIYGSEELVDPNEIPQKQGLQVLGAVSDKMYREIAQRVQVETGSSITTIKSLLEKKKLPVKQLVNQFKERIIGADLQYGNEFLNLLLKENGLLKIPSTGTFNCVEPVVNNFITLFPQGESDKDKLYNFLVNMLQYPLKLDSSMNIGPGEVYLCLFADASMSVGEGGGKSGDITVNGVGLEVKSTTFKEGEEDGKKGSRTGVGARLGGAKGYANNSLISIPEYIKSISESSNKQGFDATQKTNKKLIDEINNEIQIIKSRLNPENSAQMFNEFYNKLKNISHRNRMADYFLLNRVFKPFEIIWSLNNEISKDLLLPIKGTGKSVAQQFQPISNKTAPTFIDVYQKYITKENVPSFKETQQETPKKIKESTSRLDELLSWALNAIKELPNVEFNDIVDKVILPTNNYSPERVDISNELKAFLKTRDNILANYTSLTEAGELVGAMHLYTYKLVTKFQKLLIVNTKKGDSIIFNAPNNLQEALEIVRTPGIYIKAGIDKPDGKTEGRAQSVNIQYKI